MPPADNISLSGSESDSDSGGEETWQDINSEPAEEITVVSLVDDRTFPSVAAMLEHCRAAAGLDFIALRKSLGLDFAGSIRLVNLLRDRVRGKAHENVDWTVTKEELEDDRWLKPVLQDDELILGLVDLLGDDEDEDVPEENKTPEQLRVTNKALLAEVKQLRRQFDDYRLAVAETLDARWENNNTPTTAPPPPPKDESEYYWTSYAGNEIHETMLKDRVRTDAYRDFIYEHKDLFHNKVVLDVGCGTGILSMFCARAGAARVIAVDKSAIIHKARENIIANNLHDKITTLHGAIEELILPVDKVDIIVSEWMGYALLYEAMLPSVLLARDKWLAPDGLMVPSIATLYVAPFADPEYVADNFSFWHDVYGFDMAPMQTGIYEECRESVVSATSACGPAHEFLRLDMHTVRADDLSFSVPWLSHMARDIDALDGFLVWFDIFFTRTRTTSEVVVGTTAQDWAALDKGRNVAFTTGPAGTATHWMQTVYVVKPDDKKTHEVIKEGTPLEGTIAYSVLEGDKSARALSVDISWALNQGEARTQRWKVQ